MFLLALGIPLCLVVAVTVAAVAFVVDRAAGDFDVAWQVQDTPNADPVLDRYASGGFVTVVGERTITTFRASTGKRLTSKRLPAEICEAAEQVVGHVLVVSYEPGGDGCGRLAAFDVSDGRQLWSRSMWSEGQASVVGGDAYLSTGGKLLALDLATGRTCWAATVPPGCRASDLSADKAAVMAALRCGERY